MIQAIHKGKWSDAILSRKDIPTGPKVVLLYLLNRCDDDGSCYPSLQKIADGCGMTTPTAKRHRNWLIGADLVTVTRPVPGDHPGVRRDRLANIYTIHIVDGGSELNPRGLFDGGSNLNCRKHLRGVNSVNNGGSNLNPHNTHIHITHIAGSPEKAKKTTNRKPDPIWDVVVELFFPSGVSVSDGKRIGKIVRDLKSKSATSEQIGDRFNRATTEWKGRRFGPEALTKHWDQLDVPRMAEPNRLDLSKENIE